MSIDVPVERVRALVEQAYGLRLHGPLVEMTQGVHSKAWLGAAHDGRWVAKVSDPEHDPEAKLSEHIMLYTFLNAHGINVPVVRANRHGHVVSYIDAAGQRYPLTLMRFHELRSLAPAAITPAELRHIAGTIARMHTMLDTYPRRSTIVADVVASENQWGEQRVGVFDALVAAPTAMWFTHEELAWLKVIDADAVSYINTHYPPPRAVAHAILHGDMNFEHIRLLPEGRVYLFDFGDLCWGPVAHDLGQFLQCIFRDSAISFTRWEELRTWLVAGYISHRPLAIADIEAIDLFVINRIVSQAKYILELAGEEASPQGAAAIKRTYELAGYLVNRGDPGR